MILSEILSSLKTFTWSFSVGYKPATISAVALDEDGARADLLRLLKDITEKNKIYAPLRQRSYEISMLLWKMREEQKEIEHSVRSVKNITSEIASIKADLVALEDEQIDCLDETNYLTYGKTLKKRKLALEQQLDKFETQLNKLETDESYQKKLTDLNSRIQNLQTEDTDAEKKLREIRDSIETNDLTGPYTCCPIDLTLDYETGCGKTIGEILQGPASESKPFFTTTIFSALDG